MIVAVCEGEPDAPPWRMTRRSLVLLLWSGFATAQPAAPGIRSFRIADSLTLDPRRVDLYGEPKMALRRDGMLAVMGGSALWVAVFDSMGRRQWAKSARGDMGMFDASRWNGDSLMIIDNFTDQIVSFGSGGALGSSREVPGFVRPKWNDRRRAPAYNTFDVAAVADDGMFIGTGRRPTRMGVYGPATVDASRQHVVSIDADGIIQKVLAVVTAGVKGDQWFVLADGRVLILRPKTDSLSLIAISPAGDTVFSRAIPKVRFTLAAVGGPDGTIWLTTGMGGKGMTHTAFDRTGAIIGRLDLPGDIRVAAGDARHLWVYDLRGTVKPIRRYTLR
jgi:hypothetical protein